MQEDDQPQNIQQVQKLDSLLKMFNSEYFTDEMLLQYYHRNLTSVGVHDYLTNKLYSMSLEQVSNFSFFFCYILIKHESRQLEKFIVDSCEKNFTLFLKMFWCIHAFSATDRLLPKRQQRIDKIERCMEMGMVNQNKLKDGMDNGDLLKLLEIKQHRSNYFNQVGRFMNKLTRFSLTLKQFPRAERKLHLGQFITKMNQTIETQRQLLPSNPSFHGVSLPIQGFNDSNPNSSMVVQIVPTNYACFHTRKRVPYLLLVETIEQRQHFIYSENDLLTHQPLPHMITQNLEVDEYDPQSDEKLEKQMQQIVKEQQQSYHDALEKIMKMEHKGKRQSQIMREMSKMVKDYQIEEEKEKDSKQSSKNANNPNNSNILQQGNKRHSEKRSLSETRTPEPKEPTRQRHSSLKKVSYPFSTVESMHLQWIKEYPRKEFALRQRLLQVYKQWHKRQERQYTELWQETWEDTCEHIRQTSIYGHFPSYKVRAVIIKGGDDLRQELLIIKVMQKFLSVFQQARLNLYLRPYNITVTSATSGLVEFIPNTMSIDSLKKKFGEGTKTLYQIYHEVFGRQFVEAQKNFIESLAGYSLFTYLMNVKDRHNGNLMIDSLGHIVHIDFGFVLASSPGAVSFESAPFKLTQEYIEVMKGKQSDYYSYFRTLLIKGILELKKHVNDIEAMLRIMSEDSDLPCFYNFDWKAWRSRFMEGATDQEKCIACIDKILYNSLYSWRTAQYDNFQKITNGILP